MNNVCLRLLFFFAACLLYSSCASTPTRNKVIRSVANEREAWSNTKLGTRALAYEHYLKARLLIEDKLYEQAIDEIRKALCCDHESPFLYVSLGKLYTCQSSWNKANKEADKALGLAPNFVDALLLKATSELHTKKISKARESCARAIKLDKHRIEAYVQLANIYLDYGNQDRAKETLQNMVRANPNSARALKLMGDFYFEKGDEKLAEQSYRRVLLFEPSDVNTIQVLAGLLEQQGLYKEAIEVLTNALELQGESPPLMVRMARLYFKDKDIDAAEAYIARLREGDPSNASYTARAYAEINRPTNAIQELEQVLAKTPNLYSEHLLVAILYEELKEWDKAIEHLKQIPRDSNFYVTAQASIGYSLKHINHLEQATTVLTSALKLCKTRDQVTTVYRILADVYAKRKLYTQGLSVLKQGIHVYGDMPELQEAKANLLFEAGRGNEGVKVLQKALERHHDNVSLLYALGALYEQLGRIDECLQTMRRVLELDPNNALALNFIGYTLVDQDRDLDEAERLIRRALLLDPGDSAVIDSLGWVLYKKGQYHKALEYLLSANRTMPGEPVIIMHIGDVYFQLGELTKAFDYYDRALEANPTQRERADIFRRLKNIDNVDVKIP